MPKKVRGENSKAVEARARKADAKAAAAAQKQKEIEDEYWKDDDKHINRKMQRKAGREQKRQEELSRKQENKKLLEVEEEETKARGPRAPAGKLTRAQVEANQEKMRREQAAEAAASQKQRSHLDMPLEENPNAILAREEEEGVVGARDVDEAIAALSVKDPSLEKHPEKRVKAAFAAYEEERMPALKAENPNLRLSQLKQMLKKEWMKSPQNPLNQRFQSYNTKN